MHRIDDFLKFHASPADTAPNLIWRHMVSVEMGPDQGQTAPNSLEFPDFSNFWGVTSRPFFLVAERSRRRGFHRTSIGSIVILPRTRTMGRNASNGATPSRLASASLM